MTTMHIIRNLLKQEDLLALRQVSKARYHHPGARPGIYTCATTYAPPNDLHTKLWSLATSKLGKRGAKFNGKSFSQFISYQKDGFIHPHKDWVFDTSFQHELRAAPHQYPACKLFRVNVMIDSAAKGGELFVEGNEVKLNNGDALVFRAELHEHEVKPILDGSRMIFTIGYHHKDI